MTVLFRPSFLWISNCYLAEREKTELQEKSKSCTGATKTEYKRAIEPDISDEVPALAIQKNEREDYLWKEY